MQKKHPDPHISLILMGCWQKAKFFLFFRVKHPLLTYIGTNHPTACCGALTAYMSRGHLIRAQHSKMSQQRLAPSTQLS